MYSTSQDKTPVYLNHRVEAIHQPTAASSPTSVQSLLLRQRQMLYFEEELSDDEYSDNSGNTGLCHRPLKSVSVNSKTDAAFVIAAKSSDADGDSENGEDLQRCGRDDETKPLYSSLSQCQKGVTASSELPGCESPFVPIRCPSDQKAEVASGSSNLTISCMNCTNPDDGQLEPKHSPKLEHKAVTQVKSMSIEAPNLAQQQKSNADEPSSGLATSQPPCHATQCGIDTRIAGELEPHQHSKKEDASELFGVCISNTVTLWRSEDESFGLDVEIMSSPLKVVITGLKPGGAAERVCLSSSSYQSNISEW